MQPSNFHQLNVTIIKAYLSERFILIMRGNFVITSTHVLRKQINIELDNKRINKTIQFE